MTTAKHWPERFRVVLLNALGGPHGYSVVTWLDEKKAIALAVATHVHRHPDEGAIFDVEVVHKGRVDLRSDGGLKLERTDLTDQNEW